MSELAKLPKVDRVAGDPALARAKGRLGAKGVTSLARRAVDEARRAVQEAARRARPSTTIVARAAALADAALSARARRVSTRRGVVLHTNLGRAPLPERAARARRGRPSATRPSRSTSRRGGAARARVRRSALATLTGAESALVVNNNAAAALLMLSALAAGKSVVVSRAELVEIGGGFRVPDVLARSGAKLVEVGTTNKTREDDYAAPSTPPATSRRSSRVHQGNFRQIGFVERPSLASLVALARAKGVAMLEDLGGGALVDLAAHGVTGEPLVTESVAAGVDVVAFSTDKVLGGPQGGALVGRRAMVERARARDPSLARALRLGRLAARRARSDARLYLEGRLDEVPSLARRERRWAKCGRARRAGGTRSPRAGSRCTWSNLPAMAGGGSFAESPIASGRHRARRSRRRRSERSPARRRPADLRARQRRSRPPRRAHGAPGRGRRARRRVPGALRLTLLRDRDSALRSSLRSRRSPLAQAPLRAFSAATSASHRRSRSRR